MNKIESNEQRKINVCIVCDYSPLLPFGGIETVLKNTLPMFSDIYNVFILTTGVDLAYESIWCEINNIKLFKTSKYIGNIFIRKILTLIRFFNQFIILHRKYRFKIVHAHSNISGLPVFILSKLFRIRYLATIHFAWPICANSKLLDKDGKYCKYEYDKNLVNNIYYCIKTCYFDENIFTKLKTIFSMAISRFIIKHSDGIICLNPDIKLRMNKIGVDKNKMHLLPNHPFIDTNIINNHKNENIFKDKFDIDINDKVILYSGRVIYEKGVHLAIKSLKNLSPNIKLFIVGKGDLNYLSYLKQLILYLDLQNRVVFTGYISKKELYQAYDKCDVFIHSSIWYDMLPTTLFEIFSFNKPVIASKIGGSAWILNDNRGVLIDSSIISEISDAINKCLDNESFSDSISKNGYDFVNKFTKQTYISKLINIYHKIIPPSKKLNVVIFTPGYPPWAIGGEEYYTYYQAKELAKLNHDVNIFAKATNNQIYYENSIYKGHIKINLIKQLNVNNAVIKNIFTMITFLISFLKLKEKPHIIHGHDPYGEGIAALTAGKIFQVPVVITWHAAELVEERAKLSYVGNLYRKIVIKFADEIIVNSQFIKDIILRDYRVGDGLFSKIHVISPGVDLDEFYPRKNLGYIRKKHGINDELIVLSICRLEKIKGLDILIKSIPKVLKTFSNIKFIFVGSGSKRKFLENLAVTNNVREKIIFTGKVPRQDLPFYYSTCDVFILPTRGEGFGMVYFEAWACEKPIIATPFAPTIANLTKRFNGGIITSTTPEQIGKAIIDLLSDKPLRLKMGNIGKKMIETEYSWRKKIKENELLYKKMYMSQKGKTKEIINR